MNSWGNVILLNLVLLAEPYVGTDGVDLGTEEKEVAVQQGGWGAHLRWISRGHGRGFKKKMLFF